MDAVRDWWDHDSDILELVARGYSSDDDSTSSDSTLDEEEDWAWEVPDLSEGGAWNLE
jgi:hypothetical protein